MKFKHLADYLANADVVGAIIGVPNLPNINKDLGEEVFKQGDSWMDLITDVFTDPELKGYVSDEGDIPLEIMTTMNKTVIEFTALGTKLDGKGEPREPTKDETIAFLTSFVVHLRKLQDRLDAGTLTLGAATVAAAEPEPVVAEIEPDASELPTIGTSVSESEEPDVAPDEEPAQPTEEEIKEQKKAIAKEKREAKKAEKLAAEAEAKAKEEAEADEEGAEEATVIQLGNPEDGESEEEEEEVETPEFKVITIPIKQQNVKFELESRVLNPILSKCSKLVSNNAIDDSMKCLAFSAIDGNLSIRGGNVNLMAIGEMPCDGQFDFLVDAKHMTALCSAMSGKIDFRLVNDDLSVSNGKTTVDLKVRNYEMYTIEFPIEEMESGFMVNSEMRESLADACNFVSTDATRMEMCGVNLESNGGDSVSGTCTIAATDGLAIYKHVIKKSMNAAFNKILTKEFIDSGMKTVGKMNFSMSFHETYAVMKTSEISIYGKYVQTQKDKNELTGELSARLFPQVDSVLPNITENEFSINKTSLVKALKICSIVSEKAYRAVIIHHDAGSDKIMLTATNSDTEERSQVELDCLSMHSEGEFFICASIALLEELIGTCNDEIVHFKIKDEYTGFYVRSENSDVILLGQVMSAPTLDEEEDLGGESQE